jgi:hypothetical protein
MKPWKPRDGDVNKITGKIIRVRKPKKPKPLLLPKHYKTEAQALKAVPELVRTTMFGESMVFKPVRCVGTSPDKKPEHPRGRYNWRLRRSF